MCKELVWVNLCPHDVVVHYHGKERTFRASGLTARVACSQVTDGSLEGIPVCRTTFSDVVGLPVPVAGVVYIVSRLVADVLQHTRPDVVCPDTGKTCIRGENGNIIAVRGFSR